MSSSLTILDRLLLQAESSECREHVLEQASYAVADVQQRLLQKFETLAEELSLALGPPEFTLSGNRQAGTDSHQSPLPSWITGSRKGENARQILRFSYWKRQDGLSYIMLIVELDSKDRPNYYDIVLGGKRRRRGEPLKLDKLRQDDGGFLSWLRRLFSQSY